MPIEAGNFNIVELRIDCNSCILIYAAAAGNRFSSYTRKIIFMDDYSRALNHFSLENLLLFWFKCLGNEFKFEFTFQILHAEFYCFGSKGQISDPITKLKFKRISFTLNVLNWI